MPTNLNDLREFLFSTNDGVDACEAINKLADLAEQGSDEAKISFCKSIDIEQPHGTMLNRT